MSTPHPTVEYSPEAYAKSMTESGEWGLADRCNFELTQSIRENPSGTLMTAFGIGLGIGAAIGLSVAFSSQPKKKPRSRAEQIGQQILDSLHDYLPDAVSRRMG